MKGIPGVFSKLQIQFVSTKAYLWIEHKTITSDTEESAVIIFF